MSLARTGIEIKLKAPDNWETWGKIYHFFHLDGAVRSMMKFSALSISVDGAASVQPFGQPHIVDCAPGEHDLEVWVHGYGPTGDAAGKLFHGTKLRVVVQPGRLTQLVYQGSGGPTTHASLTLV